MLKILTTNSKVTIEACCSTCKCLEIVQQVDRLSINRWTLYHHCFANKMRAKYAKWGHAVEISTKKIPRTLRE